MPSEEFRVTHRWSEWKRTLWGLFGLLVITGSAAGIWVHHVWSHSDKLLAQVVRDNLDQLAPGLTVHFSSCHFDLLRRVRVENIELTTPDGQPLASVPQITVAIDRQTLAEHQQLVIQQITLHRPHLHLVRDSQDAWNWQDLTRGVAGRTVLPSWTIEDGQVDITLSGEPDKTRSLEQLNLQLVPSGADRYLLDGHGLFTHPQSSQPAAGLTLTGQWRVTDSGVSIHGQLSDLLADPALMQFITGLSSLPDGDGSDAKHLEEPERRFPLDPRTLSATLRGDLAFRVTRWQPDTDWDYRLLLTLKNGQLQLPSTSGPARALTRLVGQVYLDPHKLQVKDLLGHEGDTTATVNGLVSWASTIPNGHLDLKIQNLPLDNRFHESLPQEWRALYDTYNPSGSVDMALSLGSHDDGNWQVANSVLTARNCRIRHAKFPYPLEKVSGTLTQQGTSRDLVVAVDAVAGGQPTSFRGKIQNAGPAASSQIDISVNRLPIDAQLLAAVSPAARRTLESLAIRGAVDVRARLNRPAGLKRQLTIRLDGQFVDSSVKFQHFPWPIEKIRGEFSATISPTRYAWRFETLSGQHADASLAGSGHLDGQPGRPGLFVLDLDAQHIRLDQDLRAACSDELRGLWDRVRPTGRLNGRIAIRRQGTQPVQVAIPRFTIDGGTMQLTGFPYKLSDLSATGSYDITKTGQRRLTLSSLNARHENTRLATRGLLEIDQRKDWMLRLESLACNDLVADDDLLQALPPRLRQTISHLNPQRTFHLSGLIELRGAGEPGFPITAAWDLETHLPGNRLTTGVQLEDVSGKVTSRGKWYGQHAEMNGNFSLDSASLWGYQFRDIQGPFHYRNQDLVIGSNQAFAPRATNKRRLAIPLQERVTAKAVGGLFTLDAQARIDQQSTYHVKLNMSEANLEQFARLYLRDPRKLKGRMRGWVDLRGRGNSPSDLTGQGQLQVSPVELYELPIVVQLFDVLSLGPPQQTAFRYAQCDFQLARSKIQFNSIDLVGNSLQLRGRGQASFQGQVGLDFYSMLPKSRLPIPFLQPLIAPLTTGWVAVRVDGKANNPRARIRPAPVLDDALRSFLTALENPAARRQPPPLNAPFGQRQRRLLPGTPAAKAIENLRRR